MKLFNVILLAFSLFSATSFAEQSTYTKRVITGDVGEINVRGSSKAEAFKNAAAECFKRRVALYEGVRGSKIDEEHGLDIIDQCANIEYK